MWLEKGAWKSLFCYVSKVHFFVTESKLASVGSRMGIPTQGLHYKFHAKYCSALRALFSWNYTLTSPDLAFVPRWDIQQGNHKVQNHIFIEQDSVFLDGLYVCVYRWTHFIFYQLSRNSTVREVAFPGSYRKCGLI